MVKITQTQESFKSALTESLELQSRYAFAKIALIRLGAVAVWLCLAVLGAYVFNQPEWKLTLPYLSVYLLMALGLLMASRASRPFPFANYVPVVLDLVMVWWIQTRPLESGHTHSALVLGIVTAAFCLMIIGSILTMDRRVSLACFLISIPLFVITMRWSGVHRVDLIMASLLIMGAVAMAGGSVISQNFKLIYDLTEVQLSKHRLLKYFSPQIASKVSSSEALDTNGENAHVTVLFADIEGFTSMCESRDPAEIVQLLNLYFSSMVKIVFDHGGTLDKFLGDGLLAYFGYPIQLQDHPAQAIRCAVEMQRTLSELNKVFQQQGLPEIKIGIGIHTGSAIIGNIGPSFRKEFTIIGSSVNLASRIQGLTRQFNARVIVSEQTQTASKEVFKFTAHKATEVRGVSGLVNTFSPENLI